MFHCVRALEPMRIFDASMIMWNVFFYNFSCTHTQHLYNNTFFVSIALCVSLFRFKTHNINYNGITQINYSNCMQHWIYDVLLITKEYSQQMNKTKVYNPKLNRLKWCGNKCFNGFSWRNMCFSSVFAEAFFCVIIWFLGDDF